MFKILVIILIIRQQNFLCRPTLDRLSAELLRNDKSAERLSVETTLIISINLLLPLLNSFD